ncbi:hypothetical protein CSO01_10120 [Cellulomonas soli]|uniref:Uncharacterized protein n=1 Tax=Cellulomonas soli TaxID=931535 RepID=A0A512PAR5_9CELL|nr:hypothetical protein CSO01_10120 [Cellulomonas soli]
MLLLVNDRVLKDRWGSWWTGKASDLAWLVVAPPLVAVLTAGVTTTLPRRPDGRPSFPSRRPQHRDTAALALTGLGFVLVKSTEAGAEAASAVLTALAGPSFVRCDPTDLLALPALLVAWAVARSTRVGVGRRGGLTKDVRWLVVLPVAVLATVGTSQAGPPSTRDVVVVGGDVAVLDGGWSTSVDGSHWQEVPFGEAPALLGEAASGDAAPATTACVPDLPRVCFRAVEAGLGVLRSDDGGRTWNLEWSVTGEELAALAERYDQDDPHLQTVAVAVQPTATGYRVYAAGDEDGLAVRDETGAWERIGFTYYGGTPAVPLPQVSIPREYPVPPGVFVGLLAVLGAAALSSTGATVVPWSRRERTGRLSALVAALALSLAAGLNRMWSVTQGQTIEVDLILVGSLVPYLVVGGLAFAAATLAIASAGLLRGGEAAAFAAATGLGVALVVGTVTPAALLALLAFVVFAVGALVTRWAARRHAGGEAEPPVDHWR